MELWERTNLLNRLERLEMRIELLEAMVRLGKDVAAEGVDSVITYIDLQQTDDIKENS